MIDANQQRFWMLSRDSQFDLSGNAVTWAKEQRVLRMRSLREGPDLPTNRTAAINLLDEQTPATMDEFGTWAITRDSNTHIVVGGAFDNIDPLLGMPLDSGDDLTQPLHTLPPGEVILDMAMGADKVLYVLARDSVPQHKLYLIHLLASKEEGKKLYQGYEDALYDTERIKTMPLPAGENPDRLVTLPDGGALLFARNKREIWQVIGTPIRDQPKALYRPDTPRPLDEFKERQSIVKRTDLVLPDIGKMVAVAASAEGRVAVLFYPKAAQSLAQVILIDGDTVADPMSLEFAIAPFAIGWVDDSDWALLFEDRQQAIVYRIPLPDATSATPIKPLGYRYPLNWGLREEFRNRSFVNSRAKPVHYLSSDSRGKLMLKPLHHLSYPAYARRAQTISKQLIDSGNARTAWHRIYMEAHLPKGTGVVLNIAASDDPGELESPDWMEHQFGTVAPRPDVPRANWVKDASEVPFHPGLLYCRRQPQVAGLFSVLMQRPGYRVRTLTGRYLKVKIELLGNGHESPEIAAIRFYGPRFSYLNSYLPELYRETSPRRQADLADTAASGSDFLQRFLCLFESVLTPWEDQVAASFMLTNPQSAPAEALDWLATWINANPDIDLPEVKKRRFIQEATELYRWRGTLKGLEMALDIVLDDAVKEKNIILLEDFRLRRTFATILGADLSIDNDPLLMSKIPNANSYVGDTLILGDRERKEFMALYSRDVIESEKAEDVVQAFYARLANRLTVLVHKHTDQEQLALIRKVVALEIPAHLDSRIVAASKPLLIGLYSLLGIDTFLRDEPPRRKAKANGSYLGRNDFIKRLPVLDDRLEP